jgi:hypothetical protein
MDRGRTVTGRNADGKQGGQDHPEKKNSEDGTIRLSKCGNEINHQSTAGGILEHFGVHIILGAERSKALLQLKRSSDVPLWWDIRVGFKVVEDDSFISFTNLTRNIITLISTIAYVSWDRGYDCHFKVVH